MHPDLVLKRRSCGADPTPATGWTWTWCSKGAHVPPIQHQLRDAPRPGVQKALTWRGIQHQRRDAPRPGVEKALMWRRSNTSHGMDLDLVFKRRSRAADPTPAKGCTPTGCSKGAHVARDPTPAKGCTPTWCSKGAHVAPIQHQPW